MQIQSQHQLQQELKNVVQLEPPAAVARMSYNGNIVEFNVEVFGPLCYLFSNVLRDPVPLCQEALRIVSGDDSLEHFIANRRQHPLCKVWAKGLVQHGEAAFVGPVEEAQGKRHHLQISRACSCCDDFRLSPNVVDIRHLQPRHKKMQAFSYRSLRHPPKTIEHDAALASIHCKRTPHNTTNTKTQTQTYTHIDTQNYANIPLRLFWCPSVNLANPHPRTHHKVICSSQEVRRKYEKDCLLHLYYSAILYQI